MKVRNEVRETWNILADSWTNLRTKPLDEVLEFSKIVENGRVLDIGCGNCRNLIPFIGRGVKCIGLDFSQGMIKQSKLFLKRRNLKASLIIGDIENLPIKSESIENILCLATLHHVPTRESRIMSLSEIKRVGKKNCRILISVWKRYQKRFFWKLLVSFLKRHYGDVWVEWDYHGKIYKRFYHLYTRKELQDNIQKTELNIEKIWEDKRGNIWCLVRKSF